MTGVGPLVRHLFLCAGDENHPTATSHGVSPISSPGISSKHPALTLGFRTATVYGSALGMLIGLLYLAVRQEPETRSIEIWRDFIIAGAIMGMVIGTVATYRRNKAAKLRERAESSPAAAAEISTGSE